MRTMVAVLFILGCGGSTEEPSIAAETGAGDASKADTATAPDTATALDSAPAVDSGTEVSDTGSLDSGKPMDSSPDTAPADAGIDKCAAVKCAMGLVCCPSTGTCYNPACLACCMPSS